MRQAIDVILGGEDELDRIVHDMRAKGYGWRLISYTIRDRTGVDLAHETLRRWYPEDRAA